MQPLEIDSEPKKHSPEHIFSGNILVLYAYDVGDDITIKKMELRTLDSYPFNQKLSTFFDDKQDDMEKTGKHEYVLTSDEVEDINSSDIKGSFQPGGGDSYDNEFKR